MKQLTEEQKQAIEEAAAIYEGELNSDPIISLINTSGFNEVFQDGCVEVLTSPEKYGLMPKTTRAYEFCYSDCIYENNYTISIHRTREGAEKAMNDHKATKRKEYDEMAKNDPEGWKDMPFGEMESWTINETEILD